MKHGAWKAIERYYVFIFEPPFYLLQLPVTDLRTKLIAKKANQGAAHNGGAQSAKPAAAGQKAAVAGPTATDKKVRRRKCLVQYPMT